MRKNWLLMLVVAVIGVFIFGSIIVASWGREQWENTQLNTPAGRLEARAKYLPILKKTLDLSGSVELSHEVYVVTEIKTLASTHGLNIAIVENIGEVSSPSDLFDIVYLGHPWTGAVGDTIVPMEVNRPMSFMLWANDDCIVGRAR